MGRVDGFIIGMSGVGSDFRYDWISCDGNLASIALYVNSFGLASSREGKNSVCYCLPSGLQEAPIWTVLVI